MLFYSYVLRLFVLLLAPWFLVRLARASAVPFEEEEEGDETARPDYLIVGAGASGLQMALFLEKQGYSYSVLEKEGVVGSFWTKFPVFGELISVNKWTRNETQALRFDWHSMLEAPLRMLDITEDYFPKNVDWQRYMARVAQEANLKIEFQVEVDHIVNDGSPCLVLTTGEKRCARHRIFVGTGMREKKEPLLEALGGIPYSKMKRDMAKRKRACIIGNGNSGMEVAQNIYDIADRITLYGKHPMRLSSITRYTGDVRVKFLQTTENFHAKLLDTVHQFDSVNPVMGLERFLNQSQISEVAITVQIASWLKRFECELFVIATGFESNVPGLHFESRFPPSTRWYTSETNPSVHYIGWLMHEADFQKGAGGFLSGFRYLIRNLFWHVRQEDYGVPYPRLTLTKDEVVAHVIARTQVADDLIILQDGLLLRDAIVPLGADDTGIEMYHYYEGITLPFEDIDRPDVIYLYFAWGNGRRASSVFETVLRYSDTGVLMNLFLHPVIEVNGLVREIHEDLDMEWSREPLVYAVEKPIRQALEMDIGGFQLKPKYEYERGVVNQTEGHGLYEAAPLKAPLNADVSTFIVEAISSNYKEASLSKLRKAAAEWLDLHAAEASGGTGADASDKDGSFAAA